MMEAKWSSEVGGIFRQAVLMSWMMDCMSLSSDVMALWFTAQVSRNEANENIQRRFKRWRRLGASQRGRTLGCQRHRCQVSGKVEQLWKVLAQGFGQDVQKSGSPVHGFCGVQLGRRRGAERRQEVRTAPSGSPGRGVLPRSES